MTSKEMEARSGVPRANIRYYEAEGLLAPARSGNGYRDYSEEDLRTLEKIKLLRRLGVTIEALRALRDGRAELSAVLDRRLRWAANRPPWAGWSGSAATCGGPAPHSPAWTRGGTWRTWTPRPCRGRAAPGGRRHLLRPCRRRTGCLRCAAPPGGCSPECSMRCWCGCCWWRDYACWGITRLGPHWLSVSRGWSCWVFWNLCPCISGAPRRARPCWGCGWLEWMEKTSHTARA